MARRPPRRTPAGRLFPRRLHPAGADRRHRLPEQGAVYDLLFKAAAETLPPSPPTPSILARASASPRCCTPGVGPHPPSACSLHRAGRRPRRTGRWIACKTDFFLPVRVLSRLFRRLFLERLAAPHAAGRLALFGDLAPLADQPPSTPPRAAAQHEWVVYAKRPFAGPEAVLAYSPATRTASPSPIASHRLDARASLLNGRTTGPKAEAGSSR